jgi:peptidoglycan hydrolase-like protein with peptidoglycan-binding domain
MEYSFEFEAEPFEISSEFSWEEGEAERGGRARGSAGRGIRKARRPSKFPPHRPGPRRRKPPYRRSQGLAIIEPAPEGSEYIRWVQNSLNRILDLNLTVNGIADVQTRSAIRSFQTRQGLPADGIVGPQTEKALIAASGERPSESELFIPELPELPELIDEWREEIARNSPDYIRWVQSSLNQILGLRLAVDGVAGPQTRSAIRRFQQQRGLTVDGQVGPQTEGALIAAGASPPPGAAGSMSHSTPGLISRETLPPSSTLYLDLALGRESPARPMTGIFIPENYVLQPQVDLLLYLHGHKTTSVCGPGDSISIDRYWRSSYWPLREEINKSRKNIILVAPTLGPKSEPGHLTDARRFEAYLDQVMASLIEYGPYRRTGQSPMIGKIILACHSGGGLHMRKLAMASQRYSSHIRECWGFDCLYNSDDPDHWEQWARSRPDARLFVYFQNSTARLSNKLKEKQLPNVFVAPSRARNHCLVPITHWRERIQAAGFLRDI